LRRSRRDARRFDGRAGTRGRRGRRRPGQGDRDKVDRDKVDRLSKAKAPFYEPDFEALLERTLATGRRSSSADMAAAEGSRVHFVLVGTPQKR
jgi:hypothetical protein